MNEQDIAIRLTGVKKRYKLGQIGGGTLTADLQSWWARLRGKEDPNLPVNMDQRLVGKTFMALNGVDLTVHKGEALGIIGCNGAGKSTLLKLLCRVTAPTEGEIDIYGRIASMLEVGTGFNGEMTGRENIYMNGAILGMTKAEIDAKIEDIIEFSEVRDFIDTPVKRYSSGMFVKLAFSVAAHLDSEIMIMDEVLAVGDVNFQQKCLKKCGRSPRSRDGLSFTSATIWAPSGSCVTGASCWTKEKLSLTGTWRTPSGYMPKAICWRCKAITTCPKSSVWKALRKHAISTRCIWTAAAWRGRKSCAFRWIMTAGARSPT